MACDLCRALPMRTVRQLDEEIEQGERTVEELAEQYYISVPLLEDHVNRCVNPVPNSGHELLQQMLRDLRNAALDRRNSHEADPEANAAAMTHYINLMREARETIMSMERIRPSEELARDINRKILNPLMRLCIMLSVEEGNRLRDELLAVLGSENFKTIDDAIKRILRRFAARLKGESEEIFEKLPTLLATTSKQKEESISSPTLEIATEEDAQEPVH